MNLGIRHLLPEWKQIFSKQYLREDFYAGMTLALVAIPLSLAIALASEVSPATGLVTAIIAGIVCALFGGNTLSVSGPAAAMTVLVALSIEKYGFSGLVLIGFLCGFFQILTGYFKLGRFVRLMPLPVIEGFTAGIGAIIFIGQLPRALGLPPPSESHVIDVLTHIGGLIQESHVASIGVALSVIFLLWLIPRISSKFPSPLIAIGVPSIMAYYYQFPELKLIGDIPRMLPLPSFPQFPNGFDYFGLVGTSILVYGLASLETLLSSTALDKLAKRHTSNLDQELIGQGIGNMVVAFFGGIPVTGVIVRSATNVMAGAKTRRASIFHALLILASVFVFAPWISQIPIAALAGLLLFVAAHMMNPEKVIHLWHVSKSDAVVYTVTFAVIVFVDLLEGVQWGMLSAFSILALQVGRTRIEVFGTNSSEPYKFELQGPLTFLSSIKLDEIKDKARELPLKPSVIVDMKLVSEIDGSGAELLLELLEILQGRGMRVAISGLSPEDAKLIVSADHTHRIIDAITFTEQELLETLNGQTSKDPEERLRKGLQKFINFERHRYKELFNKLGKGQSPHTLFITCSDSRIQPNLITSTDPGELFIVRNVGNMIPRYHDGSVFAEGAAVDFAIGVLGVKEIVVCGHSGCGAMNALHGNAPLPEKLKSLRAWRDTTAQDESYQPLPKEMGTDEVARINALHQLENLRTYPIVREKEESGELKLHAWYFEISNGDIEIWSKEHKKYSKELSSTLFMI